MVDGKDMRDFLSSYPEGIIIGISMEGAAVTLSAIKYQQDVFIVR